MDSIEIVKESDHEFIILLFIATIAYSTYYFIAFSEKAFTLFSKSLSFQNNPLNKYCFEKIAGFSLLGLLPFSMIMFTFSTSPFEFGFAEGLGLKTVYWVLGTSLIIVPLNILIAGNPENLKQYPQLKISTWSNSTILINCSGWLIYLLAYEYLFRGVLFLGILPILGLVKSIALSTAIYVLVHLHKGAKETFGSIPVGVLMCLITIETGNIWASFFIHLVMALSNDFVALHHHPEMKYKKQVKK